MIRSYRSYLSLSLLPSSLHGDVFVVPDHRASISYYFPFEAQYLFLLLPIFLFTQRDPHIRLTGSLLGDDFMKTADFNGLRRNMIVVLYANVEDVQNFLIPAQLQNAGATSPLSL